ncbi:uncharacterized protein B0H64DRAFT_391701 [Chaetomium fimeti]|uniref:Uncharacterized protein n=1 Tax=Chaetomium fimeti TaxID=1854472 RepID=A0AAE0HIL8_9PEZI|nr:hypothetical protein B0H64DRAFT_391701 [Chaetomium fimeti]
MAEQQHNSQHNLTNQTRVPTTNKTKTPQTTTTMKASLFLFALPLASAWKLELWAKGGRKTTMSGRLDSGCNDISFTPVLNVNKARFSPKTDLLPDPKTFDLYVNKGCKGLSYRNGKGTHKLPARKIRSYKVY